MKARIVRIGNSRGVRLPKALIEQAGLDEEVELDVREGEIIISRAGRPREGWAEAARSLAGRGEGEPLDEVVGTQFDQQEWEW